MRKTMFLFAAVVAVGISFPSVMLKASSSAAGQNPKQLKLEVHAESNSYLPGEPVNLKFRIVNEGDDEVEVSPGLDVMTGYLQVFIADGEGEYRQYIGPRWGLKDIAFGRRTRLKKNEFIETEASVLWNHVAPTSHLNERAAARAAEGKITSVYALPREGSYSVKAVLWEPESGQRIEAKPIRISIEEPEGEDLQIWGGLKNSGAYALFMQTGDVDKHPESEAARELVREMERLVESHPNSRYAAHIRRGLEKYAKRLEKLRERAGRSQ